MQINPTLINPTAVATTKRSHVHERSHSGASFRAAWTEAAQNNRSEQATTVKRGDTLIGLTRSYLGENASQFTGRQLHEMAKTLAQENGIKNPNMIKPGQTLNLSALGPMSTMNALKLRQPLVENVQLNATAPAANTPVLDQTLARAVSKGYVAHAEQGAVRDKILSLANRHNFSPDDFAKLTLMESDGMNPRASNGNCHGIIQFCDGNNRGAASAGYGKNPKAILSLSVLKQLDLVDSYFDETRLKERGPASLDELYLTVLTPSARNETRTDVPLNIAGRQAASLYEGRNTSGAITRNSIMAGLHQHASDRLGEFGGSVARADPQD